MREILYSLMRLSDGYLPLKTLHENADLEVNSFVHSDIGLLFSAIVVRDSSSSV